MSERPQTPELDKLVAASEESQRLGEFLDWLRGEQGVVLCVVRRGDQLDIYHPPGGTNGLLARYFKINLDKVEQERRAVLKYVREQQGEQEQG